MGRFSGQIIHIQFRSYSPTYQKNTPRQALFTDIIGISRTLYWLCNIPMRSMEDVFNEIVLIDTFTQFAREKYNVPSHVHGNRCIDYILLVTPSFKLIQIH